MDYSFTFPIEIDGHCIGEIDATAEIEFDRIQWTPDSPSYVVKGIWAESLGERPKIDVILDPYLRQQALRYLDGQRERIVDMYCREVA